MPARATRERGLEMHRKTRIIPAGQIVTGIVLMILSAILAMAAVLSAQSPASAAMVSQSHGHYWYDVETCHDFQLYQAGKRSFSQMYRASKHADTFLKVDVGDWYKNQQDHA